MNIKDLNKLIKSIGARNGKVTEDIQAAGLGALMQIEEHGNTTPINDLIQVLSRPQVKAFSEWALAFGKVRPHTKAKRDEGQFFAYDAMKTTDLEGATEKPWDSFAPEKAESVAKAFDLQKAVLAVLAKAAAAGQPESVIQALAAAAGIEKHKVPHSVAALDDAVM